MNFIKTKLNDHRLDIIIDNPPVNILTGAVMQEMIEVLKTAKEDSSLRVVVIKGEGKAWSAGADVSEHLPGKFEEMLDVFGELCELLRRYPVPTIAAVGGMCLGGGCEVAAMCDFIIATKKALFGQPEIKVGVLPPAACAHFARKIGYANALEIVASGDTYSADDAKDMGLVHKVTLVKDFDSTVDEFAEKFTGNSGAVLRLTKKAVLKGMKKKPSDAMKKADKIYRDKLMKTEDAVEGLNAFLEKRKPEWNDR